MRTPFILLLAISIGPLTGCGDDGADSTEDDLTQAGKQLIGEYIVDGAGAFRGLALTSEVATPNGNRFFADVDTGIVCITTPCPSVERVEGTFTGGSKTITFKSSTASETVQPLLGKYDYAFADGKLSLSRKGAKASLTAVDSYCSADTATGDCEVTAADLEVPACVGMWACSGGSACVWNCGAQKSCGGHLGLSCTGLEYCAFSPKAMCGATDQTGVCKTRPTDCGVACTAPEFMQCGCDGQLYCSACDARMSGVDVTGQVGSCD